MFEERIREFFGKFLRKYSTPEDIKENLKELRKILLKADVPPYITNEIIEKLKEKIKKELKDYPFDPKDKIIKAFYDVFLEYFGKEGKISIKKKPTKILLIGLLGVGKTTTAAKLAYFFKNRGYKVCLVNLDQKRKASFEQLKQLGDKIGIITYNISDFPSLEKLDEFLGKKYEVIIYDTAGRNFIDDIMLTEIKEIEKSLNPNYSILVTSADHGIRIQEHIEKLSKHIPINSIIITKIDGSAKAGSALIASKLTNAPISFIGVGEKIEDLEEFNLKRYVSRLLGLGDITQIIKKFEKLSNKIVDKDISHIILEILNVVEKEGSISKILSLFPFVPLMGIKKDQLKEVDTKLKKYKAIILSLNKKELREPELIKNRINEIAYGAGVTKKDVLEFLNFYRMMKKFENIMKGGKTISKKDLYKLLRFKK